MTTKVQTETETVVFPPLVPADRSDVIPSTQALVRVVKNGMDLLFDAHSFAQHEPALIASGWEVYEDARAKVLGTNR